jgi:hypothetical protein
MFSQMMGWPKYFLAALAKGRIDKSVEPPGGLQIIKLIGLVGYSAATAGSHGAKTNMISINDQIALIFI